MAAIYVVAGLCIVGIILIAMISMFGGGNSGSATLAQERMDRRQAKLDQQETDDASPPTPLPSTSRRDLDDAA